MRGTRGGGAGVSEPPLKNHKVIGYLSNTCPDPMRNLNKLPSLHSMLSHHRPESETPFKWLLAGRPMMVRFQQYLDPLSTLSELDPL